MAFPEEQVEDTTGVPTAVVYEQPEDAAEWLAARGKTKLQDAEEDLQKVALIVATEAAEDAVRPFFRGIPRKDRQGLLFPSIGAYDSAGVLLDEDIIPRRYVEGIRLLAEHVVAGTFMKQAAPVGVKSEQVRYGGVTYRDNVDLSALYAIHPEEWKRISCAIPRL